MSVIETNKVWDKELNAAVAHLGTVDLPRGYATVPADEFHSENFSPWEAYRSSAFNGDYGTPNGLSHRPTVLKQEGENSSIFGDNETEETFNSLLYVGMFTFGSTEAEIADSRYHEGHYPTIRPSMIIRGVDFVNRKIVEVYGDDERTQRWRKAILFSTIGVMTFIIKFGNFPHPVASFVTVSLGLDQVQEDDVEIVRATLGSMLANEIVGVGRGDVQLATEAPTIH